MGDPVSASHPPTGANPAESAQQAADDLALALEEVGFDVGRSFPLLQGGVDGEETAIVELGKVRAETASGLAAVLSDAARRGVVLPGA